jgi:putative ABC transport system permease protein
MRVEKLISFSLRSIFRNKMRSLLTSLGIIIGVCSVIVMVAIGQGSQAQITKTIASMGTNLLTVMAPRGPSEANRITLDDVKKIKAESAYIQAISGETRASFDVVGGSASWSTTVYGVEPDYTVIKNWELASGAFFTEADLNSRNKVAVIGQTIAKELFAGEDPVGMSVRVGTTPFTIVGVLAAKGTGGMGNDQDDLILVPLNTAITRLSKSRNLSSIDISVSNDKFMDQAEAEITTIMRESHKLKVGADADFEIMNMSDIIKTASATAKTMTTLLAAIAGVSLIVGGIGIMNIMLVAVTERTREIGIRMSVGARRRDILFQFLSESVILSLMGGAIGILLSLALCGALSAFFSTATVISPSIMLASALFAAVVGVFFGYYPARKAAGLYPIEALRYE